MSNASDHEFAVYVLAPIGRDAPLAVEILRDAKIDARAVSSLSELCEKIQGPVGAILIAEEALSSENADELGLALASQGPWSNLPVILLTSRAERLFTTEKILAIFGAGCAISIIERPFRILTLLASVRVALQARQKQYQVRELLAEQAAAVQQRDEFLSIASHELKTPLTSLKLQVQMRKRYLQRGDETFLTAENMRVFVARTETQLDRLARLVDDMLDISRIDNGKLSLSPEPVDLGELAAEVVESMASQFQHRGCLLELEMQNAVGGNWDRYRMEQVIVNLLSNALKYGDGKPVKVTVHTEGPRAVLRVKDNGPGIPPEHQPTIFHRYDRGAAKKDISGLGLGLYITRQIVELHGGTIRVESQPGTGCTFVVELPAAELRAAAAPESQPALA